VVYVRIFENKQHVNIFLLSVANLKCTPLHRQMYTQGYMYPRLGTPGLDVSQSIVVPKNVSTFMLNKKRDTFYVLKLLLWSV